MAARAALWLGLLLFGGCSAVVPPTPAPSLPLRTVAPTAQGSVPPPNLGTPLISHPTGATDVVLRMSQGGGLRYPGATVEEPPLFTLYGDGRVIYATYADVGRDLSTRYDLWQARLTEEQVAALLEYALDDAGLAEARGRYGDIPIADDMTTTFELHAAGFDRSVAVYALGYDADDTPDPDARARFRALEDELAGFGSRVDAGEVAPLGGFQPEAYRITLDQPFSAAPIQPWPWPDLAPSDFAPTQAGWRIAVVDRAHALVLADPLNTVPDNLVVEGPGGLTYLIRVRPLLPDEVP